MTSQAETEKIKHQVSRRTAGARPRYLTAGEVQAVLKIGNSTAYAVMNRMAALGAEVTTLGGKRIREDDFYKYLRETRL